MLLKRSADLKYSDVTPRDVYLDRRKFLYGMGLAGGLALAGKSSGRPVSAPRSGPMPPPSFEVLSRVRSARPRK